jgi:hypothetical protein
MAKRQNDENWKIRYMTHFIFKDRPKLPGVEFKLSFIDKLRGNGFLFSSNPYRI